MQRDPWDEIEEREAQADEESRRMADAFLGLATFVDPTGRSAGFLEGRLDGPISEMIRSLEEQLEAAAREAACEGSPVGSDTGIFGEVAALVLMHARRTFQAGFACLDPARPETWDDADEETLRGAGYMLSTLIGWAVRPEHMFALSERSGAIHAASEHWTRLILAVHPEVSDGR